MEIEKLKFPVWLFNKNTLVAEYISKKIYLKTSSSLAIKKKILEDCYILDDNLNLYKIDKVVDLGNLNKIWKFEFFNPTKKIKLVFSLIYDEKLKADLLKLIKKEKRRLEININSDAKDIL